jgi:hypothetical protein
VKHIWNHFIFDVIDFMNNINYLLLDIGDYDVEICKNIIKTD